jgi:predicted lipid-binding transport protein (Tim44 family)
MKFSTWIAGALVGLIAATVSLDADAQRRLGGGKTFGKQSSQVQQRQAAPPQAAPAQQPGTAAAPAAATGTAAAAGAAARTASPMRNLLIGAAAGLGLMALASWLGFGETLATIMLFVLLGLVLMMVVGYFMRRGTTQRDPQPVYQGAGSGGFGAPRPSMPQPQPASQPTLRSSLESTVGARAGSAMDEFMRGGTANPAQPWGVPAGFDTDGFIANAKAYYGKLQAAWDSGSLEQLQEFTTNEMFITLTHELRARNGATTTEITSMNATLLGIETLAAEHVASVRFTGTLKVDGEVEAVDEVWNLSKPVDGRHGWLLAGIQQLS